ncbi:threonine/serine dehydratase [Promethearchaeum syntrophicum]|uniref:Threonine/serine dehydratase n=1 Tax=Promethearchaeum syntrophicum TaxID=2594042 RepID=A0A5B9DB10_9ARCH|nr:threonine/serine dehydratase [Candidatus Prometheoarchaeum syntrophicum]QEE15796.1 serine/threonine dehydratase [Candidatus Prometheoarchaeum syntrophicum]
MISFDDIQNAYERIKKNVNHTPIVTSRTLNDMTKAQISLKCENMQRVGAFKFRGAYNALSQLSEEEKERGVITHSSGNHAQAVALASKILGIQATIVMPNTSPLCKVNATRKTYEANVVFCQNSQDSRRQTTEKLIEKNNYTLIHPYDNDNVIAGAGTAALEFLNEKPNLDVIMAPVGGGGLLSGSSIAVKGFNPKIIVYGAEPLNADDAYRSFNSGQVEINEDPDTIADGLRTTLCERTLQIIKENVDEIFLVSEQEIIEAMEFVWTRMKIIIEPSSAVPIAAILSGKVPIENKKVGIIISGGNFNLSEFFDEFKKL